MFSREATGLADGLPSQGIEDQQSKHMALIQRLTIDHSRLRKENEALRTENESLRHSFSSLRRGSGGI
ncbi:hypothetical protein BU26DRAFT_520237 [Trematosphaeria pertusa]|uniref:Uncharacterized protein n=1 Tax=Trematosphaeria pertusa TaxID=390896 RepID=A0A6A6IER4_9PLEO|nr:uncharacterized protein BU26DRAFT_520237 [Trematosphaeria pertusa]KAF2248558.1 hypothetical protein BU26DRAFT_520237 [Trematosphaeria pertusa]